MSLARVGARVRGSHIWCPWGTLYNEVQCIMGNGHMGTPSPLCRERHYWKHYLPRTSLVDSKKRLYGYMVGYPWSARYKTPDLQNRGITDPKQGVMFYYFQEVRSTTSILELGNKSMNRWHPILVNNSMRPYVCVSDYIQIQETFVSLPWYQSITYVTLQINHLSVDDITLCLGIDLRELSLLGLFIWWMQISSCVLKLDDNSVLRTGHHWSALTVWLRMLTHIDQCVMNISGTPLVAM